MKRKEILHQMRRIANLKMELELRLQLHENETSGLNPKGYRFYFQCCYALGMLREMLYELDRRRFERKRKVMQERYVKNGGILMKALIVERNKDGKWSAK